MQIMGNKNNSQFKERVVRIVSLIPYGKVMSYGQVALYIGMPRAARQVGWILNGLEAKTPVPWWRVVNNSGRISIKGSMYSAQEQKELLEKEGLSINDNLTFDIFAYRFVPDDGFLDQLKLDPMYLEMIAKKIPFTKNNKK